MDISVYISELLFNHDCVIIPGFGGFICNYKPAEIHPVLNTIDPPSKAISFNKNLQSNDGLLINYISNSLGISFIAALESVNNWVNSSRVLLKNKEELNLKKIGKFFNDIEGNLQFTPEDSVNYLRSSFGLKVITAQPVVRGKQVELTEKAEQTNKPKVGKGFWKIAAVIALLIGITGIGELMWMGVEIKPLQLNEASTFSFVNRLFKAEERDIKPIPVITENAPAKNDVTESIVIMDTSLKVNALSASIKSQPITETHGVKETSVPTVKQTTYYVIIGAFADKKNIEAARINLAVRFPDSDILVEKGPRLTRLGFSAGTDPQKAKEQLKAAQSENSSYWLLKK